MESNNNSNFTKPSYFSQQVTSLEEQLPAILDDFEKYYVFYNMNTGNNEYRQMFDNIKNNLNDVNSKFFTISNNIDGVINDTNQKMASLDILIQKEKEKNNKLRKKLGIIKQKDNSAEILINNYKQLYDINYLKNWSLFLSIIAAGFSLYRVSKNKILV
jgi:hypothetical protein